MSPELQFEQSLYIGNAFTAILFGISLSLCIQSCFYLLKPGNRRPRNYFYASYCILLMVLASIAMASNFILGQFMWINHRDIPGGPPAYFALHITDWYNDFGTAAAVALVFTADSLMLYRCYIVLGSRLLYIVFPGLVLLASTALGIVSVVFSAEPQHFLFAGDSAVFGTAWTSLSVAYNGIVTMLICGKILYAQRRINGLISPENSQLYTGVIAIVIESALPYAMAGIMFAAVFNKSSLSIGFSAPWGGFAIISPQLIILRIAMGTAWSKNTWTGTESIKFRCSMRTTRDQSDTRLGFELESEPKFATHSSVSA